MTIVEFIFSVLRHFGWWDILDVLIVAVAIYEILSRNVQPALVIGMPAGFVAAVEAKKALRGSGLPALTNVGEKGGAVVAAAACQALLALAGQAAAMESEHRASSRGGRTGSAHQRQRTS